jgi:Protein of unknown function (DUF4236)
MPWYYRRSFGRGPVRLNLSRRGLGVSLGVKGFRVGTGPRGTYVRASRGGFVYQQYLSAPSSPRARRNGPPPTSLGPSFKPSPNLEQTILGTPVEFVGDLEQNSDAYVAELNRRRQQFRSSTAAFWLLGIVFVAALANGAGGGWYVVIIAALIGASVLRHIESQQRAIVMTYDLEGEQARRYEVLCAAFRSAAGSSMIWRLATEQALSEGRRHGGATKLLTRTATRINFGGGMDITTNVEPPMVTLTNVRLYFLPDKIFVLQGSCVSSLAYADLNVSAELDNFREDGPVPADADRVGVTWLYVNKNGTPDRRFNNNRQIAILAYSELKVQHAGISFVLQFSQKVAAGSLAGALRAQR